MPTYTRMLILLLTLVPLAARTPEVHAAVAGTASVSARVTPPEPEHANPRLKLSYRRFAVSNIDLTRVPLQGLQLDVYPVSMRWVRAGIEFEGGVGRAALYSNPVSVKYGMLGVGAGFQYPARITPFVEGRLIGGVMSGNLGAAFAIPGAPPEANRTSAATWIYARGIDAGAEFFTVGRAYFSASIGWVRSTWGGVDYAATVQDPSGGLRYKNLSSDSFTLKLGVGI